MSIADELHEAILDPGIDVRVHSLLARLRVERVNLRARLACLEVAMHKIAAGCAGDVPSRYARAVIKLIEDDAEASEQPSLERDLDAEELTVLIIHHEDMAAHTYVSGDLDEQARRKARIERLKNKGDSAVHTAMDCLAAAGRAVDFGGNRIDDCRYPDCDCRPKEEAGAGQPPPNSPTT